MEEKTAIGIILLLTYIGVSMFCLLLTFNYIIPAWLTFNYILFAFLSGITISIFGILTIVALRFFKG